MAPPKVSTGKERVLGTLPMAEMSSSGCRQEEIEELPVCSRVTTSKSSLSALIAQVTGVTSGTHPSSAV